MSLGLGSTESAESLVRAATDQRLQPESNRVSVRLDARCRLRLTQELLVDVQRLLHTSDYAI